MLHKIKTKLNLWRNRNRQFRMLEIGPDETRIPGFETLNIVNGSNVDYIVDAAGKLPFESGTFDVVYASHILEHIPWYQTTEALAEWTRILKPEGKLEIWVPNGLKITKAFVDAELNENNYIQDDGWYKFNPEKDPCIWAAGRVFTYGDGTGAPDSPNWHRAMFSPRLLQKHLESTGLNAVRLLKSDEVRGYDHGWINLGMTGIKKAA
ncbi:class I SAM-dependent methyltransferase [Poriferisphaera sp. WC338]|uniref:class I SAM-dependent methyltransferase n=1 Tax=Poriferisphaera sp. WC338 TaxID=3425129 RepID=UPI003D81B0CA